MFNSCTYRLKVTSTEKQFIREWVNYCSLQYFKKLGRALEWGYTPASLIPRPQMCTRFGNRTLLQHNNYNGISVRGGERRNKGILCPSCEHWTVQQLQQQNHILVPRPFPPCSMQYLTASNQILEVGTAWEQELYPCHQIHSLHL